VIDITVSNIAEMKPQGFTMGKLGCRVRSDALS